MHRCLNNIRNLSNAGTKVQANMTGVIRNLTRSTTPSLLFFLRISLSSSPQAYSVFGPYSLETFCKTTLDTTSCNTMFLFLSMLTAWSTASVVAATAAGSRGYQS
ncbi:hypothetical protein K435DRAFT_141254 [Dendrothele bispora CBS 962.96]|uniref:Uncharacterized protein n=1 Tax=Dendrothele bispora (strain CBS 962.96) TaxID=1314807 RepID=A0A4S8KM55_DENBC|nr:hypothetical protein K435DRAFT_141254 [Dendrothele bispora CBS 962.96]